MAQCDIISRPEIKSLNAIEVDELLKQVGASKVRFIDRYTQFNQSSVEQRSSPSACPLREVKEEELETSSAVPPQESRGDNTPGKIRFAYILLRK